MVFEICSSEITKGRNFTHLYQKNNRYLQEVFFKATLKKLRGKRAVALAFADCYAVMIRFAKTNM